MAIVWRCLRDLTLSRLSRTVQYTDLFVTDRQTDRQTQDDALTALAWRRTVKILRKYVCTSPYIERMPLEFFLNQYCYGFLDVM